jgi:hypothetical protein
MPCSENGTCINEPGSYICNCPDHLEGPACGTAIDRCGRSPCLNGGICISGFDSFACICGPLHIGDPFI